MQQQRMRTGDLTLHILGVSNALSHRFDVSYSTNQGYASASHARSRSLVASDLGC